MMSAHLVYQNNSLRAVNDSRPILIKLLPNIFMLVGEWHVMRPLHALYGGYAKMALMFLRGAAEEIINIATLPHRYQTVICFA